MKLKNKIAFIFLIGSLHVVAQFPPPAGQAGSTAIFADSSVFTSWANHVEISTGLVQIDDSSLGYADYGVDNDALSKADNMVVSLGDEGSAVFQFDLPIMNGQGPDFAIFENSMWDDFLELCFVEVSSDGQNFVRFPAISNVPNDTQLGGFGLMDASLIHNFGGKYRGLFGTPFDLEELKEEPGLDVDQITHVRLIDVVGNLDSIYASYDSGGNTVNDPWPTPWNTSGFDLDALGVIHSAVGISEFNSAKENIRIAFLNEEEKLFVRTKSITHNGIVKVYDLSGKEILQFELNSNENEFDLSNLVAGFYVVNAQVGKISESIKVVIQ